MLRFKSLSQKPRHFHNFTGLTVVEFNKLKELIKSEWQQTKQDKYKVSFWEGDFPRLQAITSV